MYSKETIKAAAQFITNGEMPLLSAHSVKSLLSNSLAKKDSYSLRAAAICHICGFTSKNEHMIINSDGESVVLKSENTNVRKKLSGNATFSSIKNKSDLAHHARIIALTGFHKNIHVYTVAIPFAAISKSLENRIERINNHTILKLSNQDWQNLQDVELIYYFDDCKILGIEKMSQILTSNMIAAVNTLSYR